MEPIVIIFALVVGFVVVFALSGVKIIQQAETMVIERLGRYQKTLHSGINVIFPVLDKPRTIEWVYTTEGLRGQKYVRKVSKAKIDLRENIFDFPRQNVITRDNVAIEINAMLYFQITDPVKAVYEIVDLPAAIEKLTQTTLRNVIGELDLDETLTSRDTINSKLRVILDEATDKWGVKVNRVELQDINPPEDIKQAMEKQMRAERDRRAAILEAEGMKQSAILKAEGVKMAQINEAEGKKQAQILVAEGEAEAKKAVADAEAAAVKRITEEIAASGGDPANYIVALRYVEALKEMVSGQDNKIVYMPYEATGLLSSIGGIKDMLAGLKK
jgi:regulator of protease activity HflC (stomatin/prohibitin superfamily)